jgi:hypothetical protein
MKVFTDVRRRLAATCFVTLVIVLWTGATLLVSLGIVLAIALAASGASGEILFSHLENLSVHYLAADAHARAVFERDAAGLFAGIVILCVLLRLPQLVSRLKAGLAKATGDA